MRPELWRIYDKKGSNLNLNADSYINLIFASDIGQDAEGYAVTDPSGNIIRTVITNSGWNYDNETQVLIDFTFSELGTPYDVSANITYKDVSVFNPDGHNSQAIGDVTINFPDSSNYMYPGATYVGALFLDPISQGLVETEHLTILEEISTNIFVTPYDTSNSTLIFRMVGEEDVIQFFDVDPHSQEVIWTDEIIYDVSQYQLNQGIQLNIGFRSDDEGVYERKIVAYHRIGDTDMPILEIIVNAQSIGQDERLDTLLENFGLFKPKSIPTLFKEADINEDMPDWQLLNYKAKHIILEHDKIMPFIGTYKGLINAIKWLGYDDIYVKEWFKDVKESKRISLYVPYDADGRKRTIKYFTPEERKNLKKLNQLSLCYCITRETGEVDEWGNPITENCYEYNLNEILIKLYSLKVWLEKNIIGVNARIYDLTGEGVYFERYRNLIYGTSNVGTEALYEQSLTPTSVNPDSELVTGDASMLLTLKEYNQQNTIQDINCTLLELARFGWDPCNGLFSPVDYYDLPYVDPSAVFFGSPFIAPFKDLYDIQWKVTVEKEYGVLTNHFVTNPLFIYENEIKFYNTFDTSTIFNDDAIVQIEQGFLRDPSIDEWVNSIAYSVYQSDPSIDSSLGSFIFESSMGLKQYTWQFTLIPDVNPLIQYAFDENYKAPLLTISGYKWTDVSGNTHTLDKPYYLDIIDGAIFMSVDASSIPGGLLIGNEIPVGDTSIEYTTVKAGLDFNYDTSLDEQQIKLSVIYIGPRLPIFNYDPAEASTLYYNPEAPITVVEDNSVYQMNVNYTGDYEVQIYGWNGQNNMFFNIGTRPYNVWQKYPKIFAYQDTSCFNYCSSTIMPLSEASTLIYENKFPVFDRQIPLQSLELQYDIDGRPYILVPSITYFQDVPEPGSIARFYNLTERISDISGSTIIIDEDFQRFYEGDDIRIVHFDKGKYSFITETSARITSLTNIDADTVQCDLDSTPPNFVIDVSTEWYVLNNTERGVANGVNDLGNKTFTCDISSYQFEVGQMAAILILDNSTGYTYGSSFKTLYVDGSIHEFEGVVPEFVIDNPGKYTLTVKHAYSAFADFQIDVSDALESGNNFHVYLDDTYCHQYFLDDTFVFVNILFDQDRVLRQWYDVSDNLLQSDLYGFNQAIELDISTLVIFRAEYEANNYMLDQKNIWEIRNHNTNDLIMRVHNPIVPYIFNEAGDYDIKVESYDKYGNLKTQVFEGLVKINGR